MILLLVLLVSSFYLSYQPNLKAQSGSNIVNIPITFHGYSLLLRDSNGSFCVYDGADGAPPDQANAVQADLISQISGTYSGFSYWSAVVIWAIKLPRDLHVQGTVNVRAFISSTFKLSGFFSGGGYGMGLVDIDENNNLVQQFITQGPESIGSNPFTQTPTQYSVNTNVDYVFKAGHALGFAVGLGATAQGFTSTVYFGSSDRNSGASLPIVDSTEFDSFTLGGQSVVVASNSAISNCQFDSASGTIRFTAQLINYTNGFCNVSIPKALMQSPFTITSGSKTYAPTLTENSTYYQLYFTHTRSAIPIQITGTTGGSPTASFPPGSPTASPAGATPPSDSSSSTTSPATKPTPTPVIPEYSVVAVLVVLFATGVFLVLNKKRRLNR